MSRSFLGKRKRGGHSYQDSARPEEGALILSGDAAQVDYDNQVPLWKQEVTDERGRKRLHGAFTGGFSAGYFNTVGSAEGWTPSSFVSSRTSRQKVEQRKAVDYMDEEDLAEIIDDRELRIKNAAEKQEQARLEQENVDRSTANSAPLAITATAEPGDTSRATDLAVIAKSHLARKKLARPLHLEDDDGDEDSAYDIGPKIKYDSTLAKRKHKGNSTAQHAFVAKKTVRNPEPEAERVQRSKTPDPPRQRTPESLLPSIGWSSRPPLSSSSTNDPAANTSVTHSNSNPNVVPSKTPDDSKIPPWRRAAAPGPVITFVSPAIAQAALQSTFSPYPLDAQKDERYRQYLESAAGIEGVSYTQGDMAPDAWVVEAEEFNKCALMYKPMTGAMSKKFTSGSSSTHLTSDNETAQDERLLSEPVQAARAGKFGHLTRSIETWTPNRLLCKRFNVAYPDDESRHNRAGQQREYEPKARDINKAALEALMKEA